MLSARPTSARELGRENDIDSFASRASLTRQRVHAADASASEWMRCLRHSG